MSLKRAILAGLQGAASNLINGICPGPHLGAHLTAEARAARPPSSPGGHAEPPSPPSSTRPPVGRARVGQGRSLPARSATLGPSRFGAGSAGVAGSESNGGPRRDSDEGNKQGGAPWPPTLSPPRLHQPRSGCHRRLAAPGAAEDLNIFCTCCSWLDLYNSFRDFINSIKHTEYFNKSI